MGMDESMEKSSGEGGRPAETRFEPSMATMAPFKPGNADLDPRRLAEFLEFPPQLGVGAETAADDQDLGIVAFAAFDGLARQNGGHGVGQGGADVIDRNRPA